VFVKPRQMALRDLQEKQREQFNEDLEMIKNPMTKAKLLD